jgi:hypothetical protein
MAVEIFGHCGRSKSIKSATIAKLGKFRKLVNKALIQFQNACQKIARFDDASISDRLCQILVLFINLQFI